MRLLRRLLIPLCITMLVTAACGDETEASAGDGPNPVEPDGGIGDSPFGSVPFFGANDDQCTSVTLTNSEEDETLRTTALDCFFAEYDAGTPVVVDLSIATDEGDAIYHRYLYDGAQVSIVIDNRADSFGSPMVDAQNCASIAPGEFLPVGVDCVPIADHPGFPEAEG